MVSVVVMVQPGQETSQQSDMVVLVCHSIYLTEILILRYVSCQSGLSSSFEISFMWRVAKKGIGTGRRGKQRRTRFSLKLEISWMQHNQIINNPIENEQNIQLELQHLVLQVERPLSKSIVPKGDRQRLKKSELSGWHFYAQKLLRAKSFRTKVRILFCMQVAKF